MRANRNSYRIGISEEKINKIDPRSPGREVKYIPGEDTPTLDCKYHGCWWPGEAKAESNNRRGDRLCVREFDHHWFRLWLAVCSMPSHNQNHCWSIVNWAVANECREILIQQLPYKKLYLEMSTAKWRPFCLGLDVLTHFCLSQKSVQ